MMCVERKMWKGRDGKDQVNRKRKIERILATRRLVPERFFGMNGATVNEVN